MDYVDKTDLVGSCYRIHTIKDISHDVARDICRKEGAELLVIDNEVEQYIVASMLAEVPPDWTFYTDFTRGEKNYYYVNNKAYSRYLFTTRHGESLDEVGYAPWQEDKFEVPPYYAAMIIVNASNGMYTERKTHFYNSRPFCEKKIPKLPPF